MCVREEPDFTHSVTEELVIKYSLSFSKGFSKDVLGYGRRLRVGIRESMLWKRDQYKYCMYLCTVLQKVGDGTKLNSQ